MDSWFCLDRIACRHRHHRNSCGVVIAGAHSRKKKAGQAVCLSNLKQIGLAVNVYLTDNNSHFPDQFDLKSTLPGGYRPWTTWPPSDPRAGWAAMVFKDSVAREALWPCPLAMDSPTGKVPQSLQPGSANANPPSVRYWMWHFDRSDHPVGQENFWGKSESQAVSDLVRAAITDATLGVVNGATEVELLFSQHH